MHYCTLLRYHFAAAQPYLAEHAQMGNVLSLLRCNFMAQGAPSCWFSTVGLSADEGVNEVGEHSSRDQAPLSALLALERTIQQRREEAASSSGTAGNESCDGRHLL